MFTRYLLALLICAPLFLPPQTANAQGAPLGEEARVALATAETAMQVALETYERHYPDRPLWREAINYAKEAVRLAPDSAEPLRLLAEIYSRSNWYGPAWDTWNSYLSSGQTLPADAAALFVDVGSQLGYTRYRQGQPEAALEVYRRVLEVVPYAKEPNVWSGRILLELGQPEAALPYWETVAARDSTDERAQYFLALARNQVQWGVSAATAFSEGVARYEEGSLPEAAAKFVAAAQSNPEFTEAQVWAGRTLLELGRPAEAVPYWQTVTERDPGDERARYFLALARDQTTWGSEVANAFRAGVAAYEAGDRAAAARQFETATSLRSDYAEAWAWRGRVAFERADYGAAATYYGRATDLQPGNDTYRYFLEEAGRRTG